jgi:putative heme-binding domain-containing protein
VRRLSVSLAAVAIAAAAAAVAASQQKATDWKMADLLPSLVDLGVGHDFEQGRQVFKKAGCGGCHAFASESEGAGLAPDLTPVASKYGRDFILQSILEPSATINGQFFHTKFTLKNGTVIIGSIIDVVDKKIIVAPVMLAPQATIEIAEADVKTEEPSAVSPMPAGLLNPFTKAEIVELFAFLDAGGDRTAAVYKKKSLKGSEQ